METEPSDQTIGKTPLGEHFRVIEELLSNEHIPWFNRVSAVVVLSDNMGIRLKKATQESVAGEPDVDPEAEVPYEMESRSGTAAGCFPAVETVP